ncbi:hypothetical protein NliqN6_3939 [Naganishia liquefaciens]|uniref:Uncharacterized protein n=1 Tax=Naganishia liquefaciens TaxID=104408 RepID=A0A8H3YGT4_9TREE|nr:hypothetical protein NliqN6_3939 [Naganishia liquefaciens]
MSQAQPAQAPPINTDDASQRQGSPAFSSLFFSLSFGPPTGPSFRFTEEGSNGAISKKATVLADTISTAAKGR